MIIGVAGQLCNGKDVIADHLYDKLKGGHVNWKRSSFASNVKKVFCETFNWTIEELEAWKRKTDVPPNLDITVRQALQHIGDGFRKIKSTIWIDLTFRDSDSKIISDVRYINELSRIKKEGGINILVVRPDMINDDTNGSEAQLRPLAEWVIKYPLVIYPIKEADFEDVTPEGLQYVDIVVLNNKGLEELKAKVDKYVIPYLSAL